jgi:exodeoxyribonuclease VII large subunit
MQNQYTLLELNNLIKNVLSQSFTDYVWVMAEISELNENRSGHCYLEMIEKSPADNRTVARTRANIWANMYRFIKPYFESVARRPLGPGMKILCKAAVEYHELYGISLTIIDIDPNYTLGDMARRRQEIIDQLTEEGVIDLNRELELPLVIQKIAIISSETAAGFGDFKNQLENNSYGYKFYYKLYPALMQGDRTEESILNALDRICETEDFFDAVVIIRGGGSKAELASFDSYLLAAGIAQFPLPVLTGIGHDRDESIADLVAHTNLKTPTAVAEFIIDHANTFETGLRESFDYLVETWHNKMEESKTKLNYLQNIIGPVTMNYLAKQKAKLNYLSNQIPQRINQKFTTNKLKLEKLKTNLKQASQNYLNQSKQQLMLAESVIKQAPRRIILLQRKQLEMFEKTLKLRDPQNILELGYSLSVQNGRIIMSANDIDPDLPLETRMRDGKLMSHISEIDLNE